MSKSPVELPSRTEMQCINRRMFMAGPIGLLATGFNGCGAKTKQPQSDEFDVCIVGSGLAGTFLALELVAQGLKTIVIEAGTHPGISASAKKSLAQYFQTTNSGRVEYNARGVRAILVGGTSVHWGGVVSRLFPDDLRMRSKLGVAIDWLITYETLEPYYCRSEMLLDVRGYLARPGIDPPRSCDFPVSPDHEFQPPKSSFDGVTPHCFGVARSRQTSQQPTRLLKEHIPSFLEAPYATLMSDRQVTRLTRVDGKHIDHVETRTIGEDSPLRVRARMYVLAAGAIGNPPLLLLSRSARHPEGLGNHSGQVGRYFNVTQACGRRPAAPRIPAVSFRTNVARPVMSAFEKRNPMRFMCISRPTRPAQPVWYPVRKTES